MHQKPPTARIGPYAVAELIGLGGMGAVYRARDTELGRDVAIKFLAGPLSTDPRRLARFEREARTLASLNHPNIGAIYGVADDGATRGLVLELVEGPTLAHRLAGRRLPVDEALALAVQIANALEAAHDKAIVHRDLKPSNIKIAPGGVVKVLDFGVAKALRSDDEALTAAPATLDGAVIGTARYMSPEQARGESVDARADVWAFGCVVFEMLTGRPAFAGESAAAIFANVIGQEPDWSALPAGVPEPVRSVLRKCLAKDPRLRLRSISDARLELTAVAAAAPGRRSRRMAGAAVAAVVSIAAAAIGWALMHGRGVARPPAAAIRSIAVRPLENLSRDPSQDYFVEGMTDALTTQLAKLGGLRVASRTSSLRFADKPVAEVARALKVDGVVEGSVLFADDRVRVTARLIDAATDTSLWAESYERGARDVLLLQRDVARDIAERIQVAAAPARAAAAAAPAVDPEAYREYLKGRYLTNRRTADALQEAVKHFERAIELQPDYAPAHAAVAQTLVLLSAQLVGALPTRETLPRARAAAQRALQLDESDAGAHAALGRERLHAWDWKASELEARRSVALEPNNATWRFWYASTLAAVGRHEEAIAEARAGVDLDPVSPIVGAGLSWMYHLARRFDEALKEARRVLEFEPTFAIAHSRAGEALAALGRRSEAIPVLRRAFETSGGSPDMLALVGQYAALAGQRAEALKTLDTLLAMRRSRHVSGYNVALVYAGLGDKTRALEWLERAVDGHEWAASYLNVDPGIDAVRGESAFRAMVRRVGLEPR